MKSITDKIALQNLINSYLQETGQGRFIPPTEQSASLLKKSRGLPVLSIVLHTLDANLYVSIAYQSSVGRQMGVLEVTGLDDEMPIFYTDALHEFEVLPFERED